MTVDLAEGLCARHPYDPALWDFEVYGETYRQQQQRRWIARDVCFRCPVRDACTETAQMGRDEGTWGGRRLPGIKVQSERRAAS